MGYSPVALSVARCQKWSPVVVVRKKSSPTFLYLRFVCSNKMLLERNGVANPVLFIELYEFLGEASEVSHSENFNLGMKPVLQLVACCSACSCSHICCICW